jgi:hypothetical protein
VVLLIPPPRVLLTQIPHIGYRHIFTVRQYAVDVFNHQPSTVVVERSYAIKGLGAIDAHIRRRITMK